MKWEDITITECISEITLKNMSIGYTNTIKIIIDKAVRKVIGELSDRDIPDNLFIKISVSDKLLFDRDPYEENYL